MKYQPPVNILKDWTFSFLVGYGKFGWVGDSCCAKFTLTKLKTDQPLDICPCLVSMY